MFPVVKLKEIKVIIENKSVNICLLQTVKSYILINVYLNVKNINI